MQTWLPVISQFRAPVRYTLFAQWALAVLASLALAQLLRRTADGTRPKKMTLWAPWAVVGLAAVSAAWLRPEAGTTSSSAEARLAVWYGPLVLALAAGLLTCVVRGAAAARMALVALTVLAGVDLALYGVRGVVAWQDFLTRPQAVGYLDTNGFLPRGGAVRLLRGGFPNLYLFAGHRLADGYLGMWPRRLLDYRQAAALRLAQVEYRYHADALQGAQLPDAEALERGWLRLRDPLPRARLVTDARVSTSPAAESQWPRPRTFGPRAARRGVGRRTRGHGEIVVDEPGDIGVATRDTRGRQMLIVSESFDEGWTAAIDGVRVPVERVNGDFLGCVVPPGDHVATFVFRPRHLVVGQAVSVGGVLLALAIGLVGWRSS